MSLAGAVNAEPGRRAPYLCDQQWRVVWLHNRQDLTFREIGQRLCIVPSTLKKQAGCFNHEVVIFLQPIEETYVVGGLLFY